jgi:phosphoribosyl-ATP pyrophosphohydrolase/phosphoribosyl-AMP cyclohydrolase
MVTDAAEIERNAAKIRFDERGLVPCVMQDSRTGEVLTLAYMNEEALRLTLERGEVYLYSRSRRGIWHKGATSGNVQRVQQLRYDCDADAEVDGPAIAGEPLPVPYEALPALERTLLERQRLRPQGSYTVELLDDPRRIAAKVKEEAGEVIKAAAAEPEERVAEEAADLIYHLTVLLLSRGVSMAEVLQVLNGRRG